MHSIARDCGGTLLATMISATFHAQGQIQGLPACGSFTSTRTDTAIKTPLFIAWRRGERIIERELGMWTSNICIICFPAHRSCLPQKGVPPLLSLPLHIRANLNYLIHEKNGACCTFPLLPRIPARDRCLTNDV